jgi:hypothetical protein
MFIVIIIVVIIVIVIIVVVDIIVCRKHWRCPGNYRRRQQGAYSYEITP